MLKKTISTILFCTIFIVSGHSQIRYVSQLLGTPTGDGLSWATASNDLQAMLNDVPNNGFIKLEAGIYTPNDYPVACSGCASNRDFAFYTDRNLTIEGGYIVGGVVPVTGPQQTILSGDIGVLGDITDNTHHVFLSNSNVRFDNLSVSFGNANVGGMITVDGTDFMRSNGAGIYMVDGSANMKDILVSDNNATNQGGGLYLKNSSLHVEKCAITNNFSNQGGGMFIINDHYQNALIEKSVIANNVANEGGAMFLSDPPRDITYSIEYGRYNFKIEFCTYYGNIASNGSVLYTTNIVEAKLVFYNSVVYGNGPNIHNYGEPHLYAINSIIQGAVSAYPPIRSEMPDFINASDLDGIDDVFFTNDDGLVPQVTGAAALTNIGAYLWNTSLCPSATTLYVDINIPIPGDGSSWATAFADLNLALNFARRCSLVQEVRVAQGTYNPGPYNWYPRETGEEYPSATFILRPGLVVFGGYPTGGGTRDPVINLTTLTGITRNIVSIHEPNNDATDTTILDGFTIQGAYAAMTRRARTESYFSTGAGIKIQSNYVKINGNIIKENSALKASAIEVIGDHVEISNNTITDNITSPSTYFRYIPKGSLITVQGDSCQINYNIISNNLLGDASIILDIKGSNHNIKGNDINTNPSEPIYLQSYKSTCSFNAIKNNYGNGIKILGDSCVIFNNDIENNFLNGIFALEKITVFDPYYEPGFGGSDPGVVLQYKNFTKIHGNSIKSNQQKGIKIEGNNDADVYANTIIGNLSDGVVGASSVWGNVFFENLVAIRSDSATIHHNVIEKNEVGILVDKGQVFNNYVVYNDGGLSISLGNVYNNVFAANEIDGGVNVTNSSPSNNDSLELHITNNTFYANKSNNLNHAGGIFIQEFKGDTIEISNNIFYQNSIDIFTAIAGSDYRYNKLLVDFPPIFKNNMMQLGSVDYAGVTNNNFGVGSVNNLYNAFPDFFAGSDLDGLDDVYMTRDDGLVLGEFSVGIDAGFDQAIAPIASIDIAGIPRILGPQTDIGAYEKLNCVSLDTLYVNKNHVHTTGGEGWLSALTDLDVALWLAHECTNVSVINVSADEYAPKSKPYEMQISGKGVELITSDDRDKTFHLRTGLNLYGGFLVRGATARRDPEKFRTVLRGTTEDASVIHTVMMSFHKEYWLDALDTTLLDGFNIIGGEAKVSPTKKLNVNNNAMLKSQGGGITIYGGTNKIINCTIESSEAILGGAIYLNEDTTIIEQSVIKDNLATTAAAIASVNGNYKFINNYFVNNNADTTACIEIKDGVGIIINNAFDGNKSMFRSGALTLSQGSHSIVNNTFFNNESTEVGALYIDGGNVSISNNIFNKNKKTGLFDIVGSDYQHSATPLTIAFNNNGMQLAADTDYNTTNKNELGGGLANLFDINPIFYDTIDMAGEDNNYGTFDDGLRLLVGSPMINIGENTAIPPYIKTDIYGSPRIQKSIVELGAYEGPNVKCPEGIFDTLFVDHTLPLSGNGSSWAQAFRTLDEAIFITHMCPFIKYICVAQGTYYPTAKPYNMQPYLQGIEVETPDPRDASFHIRDGVVLLGGYKQGGQERNLNNFQTILSGDINQNGTNQAYHTLVMASSPFWFIRQDTTIADGITAKDANANNPLHALEINNSPLKASNGGGLYMTNGYHAVKNSTIEQNFATEKGGGLYSYKTKSTTIKNNSINDNSSADGGGVYINHGEKFEMGYNSISSNNASANGGGLYLDSTSNILFRNIVKSNSAKYGGGFFIKDQFKIEDSDFLFNTSTVLNGQGGGIYTTKSYGSLDRCVFDGNMTDLSGGGLFTFLCDSIFVWNSLFHNNDATNAVSLGGAVYNDKNKYFEQINCTTYANNADEGESIYTSSNNPILRNNIYYDSNPISTLTGAIILTNSIVKGGHPSCASCPGALGDVDPSFVDDMNITGMDGKYRTEDDGFNVKTGSPALNNGASHRYMSHDITFRLRDWGHRDIGAYETFKCPINNKLYVDKQVSGGEGIDWNTPLSEVSTALYVSQLCPNIEEIHVAKGVYLPNYKPFEMQNDQIGAELYTTSDLDKTFHVRAGLYLFGGYKNGGTNRDRDLFPSTLSGNISDSTFDARHVVLLGGDNGVWTGLKKINFDGFHVAYGHAISAGGLTVNKLLIKYDVGAGIYGDYLEKIILNDNVIHHNLGHGVYMYGGQNEVTHNLISNNIGADGGGAYFTGGINILNENIFTLNSASQGGGLFLYQDSTILTNNLIDQNTSTSSWGGGLFAQESTIELFHNTITSNISKHGGGAFIESTNFILDSNSIKNNSASQFGGGGMHFEGSNGRLYKNSFISNNAGQYGGGMSIAGGDIEIESNLFTKNKSGNIGGGISAGNAELLIVNNVFYKDTAQSGAGIQTYYGFSKIQNNTFFQNEASINGGAYATGLGANDLTNNIFYENTKAGANVIGADFYNDVFNESFNVFNNNSMQFAENEYTSSNNNVLYVNTANVFNIDPQFVDDLNVSGIDMVFGNGDDGLILQNSSPLINVGNKTLISESIMYDAKHEIRVINYQIDLGAYETFRDPCISNVIYVDTNVVAGFNGQNWSHAFQTLSEALFVAHNCPNVDTILIAEGTYFPESKPYEMGGTMIGQEIITSNHRDLTFHIRQGLTLIGGFPGGGDESPSTYYKTTLAGTKEFSAFPSYHTVMMDTSAMWTHLNKKSSIQYCVIKGGAGETDLEQDSILVNGSWLNNSRGGGIYINAARGLLKHNSILRNDALTGGGLFIVNSPIVQLSENEINENFAEITGAGVSSVNSILELMNNLIMSNNSSRDDLRGLTSFEGIIKLLGNNSIQGMNCMHGTLEVVGLNTIK